MAMLTFLSNLVQQTIVNACIYWYLKSVYVLTKVAITVLIPFVKKNKTDIYTLVL
jgi:hypothetical protein